MTSRIRTLIATALAVVTITAMFTAPASAQSGGLADTHGNTSTTAPPAVSTTVPTGASVTDGDTSGAVGIQDRYTSLTAAMMGQWADRTGADVNDLIGDDGDVRTSALGQRSADLRTLGVDGILGDLDTTISDVTLGVSGAGVDFDRLAASLPSILQTPDGAAIAAGVYSARSLAKLDTPTLTGPGLLANAAPLDSVGAESLAFGLFLNQSLTSLAQNSPDVFSMVMRPGGVADASANAAWGEARSNAAARLGAGFGNDLMNPCLAVMLSSASSGNPNGVPAISGTPDGCQPCAVAGAYMNGYIGQIIDGKDAQRLIIHDDGAISDYEWWVMGEAGHEFLYNTYDSLNLREEVAAAEASQDPNAEARRLNECTESRAGTANFLEMQSAGIIGRLGG